ncbi:type II toxin-antitoxin system Phd/YefM family antitoxin [Streptomyces sp. B21-083]|uniref:type II toxin-antitoxin system Phd/YefM family antitoxin n=1 Tax=Streptomyces sp. B21-083 TaxID=3039410 RepID=UPI002FEE760F
MRRSGGVRLIGVGPFTLCFVSAEDYAALREGSYLLRSPVNARRLLKAYENALSNVDVSERELIDPDAVEPAVGTE